MESYITLYNIINIFCIFFAILFIAFSNRGLHDLNQKRVLNIALIGLIFLFASDTLWYSMDQKLIPQNLIISHILKGIYFFSSCFCGFMWFLYFEVAVKSKFLTNKRFLIYTPSLFLLGIVLLIINIFTGIIFKIEEVNGSLVYSRGALFPLIYLIIYIYVVISSIRCIYFGIKAEVDKAKYFILASFPVIPLICAAIQLFYWRLPIVCIGLIFSCSICYLESIEEQVSTDPLLDINNRRKIMFLIHRHINNYTGDNLYLFMLDLDKFKSINDTYGHLEGDKALITTVESIKKVLQKYNKLHFGRYGGDEFIIFGVVAEPEELINDINEALEEASKDLEYKILISVGYAKYDKSIKGVKDFINLADKMLYENKNKKK